MVSRGLQGSPVPGSDPRPPLQGVVRRLGGKPGTQDHPASSASLFSAVSLPARGGGLWLPPSPSGDEEAPRGSKGLLQSRLGCRDTSFLWGRFGPIDSIRCLPHKSCAFINYSRKEAAEAAYAALQVRLLPPFSGPEGEVRVRSPAPGPPGLSASVAVCRRRFGRPACLQRRRRQSRRAGGLIQGRAAVASPLKGSLGPKASCPRLQGDFARLVQVAEEESEELRGVGGGVWSCVQREDLGRVFPRWGGAPVFYGSLQG